MSAREHLSPFRTSPLPRWDVRIANDRAIIFERFDIAAARAVDALGRCLAEESKLRCLPRTWDPFPADKEAFECRSRPDLAALVTPAVP